MAQKGPKRKKRWKFKNSNCTDRGWEEGTKPRKEVQNKAEEIAHKDADEEPSRENIL